MEGEKQAIKSEMVASLQLTSLALGCAQISLPPCHGSAQWPLDNTATCCFPGHSHVE